MKLTLKRKLEEAKGTVSFFFETEREIKYLPGQFVYVKLPALNYPDKRGTTRHFTISSSPTEGKEISITTRVREESGYKKTLNELKEGSVVDGEGPNGTFIIDEAETGPHVFLAGGIGITPFRSAIKYAVDKKAEAPMHLIYSNSVPEEITFREDLEKWSRVHPSLKLDLTVSKPELSKTPWKGITGRIDGGLISKLVDIPSFKGTFWVCGPPPMVSAVEEALEKLKVPSSSVRSEKFTGY